MNTSHNYLNEPGTQEAAFLRARGYLHDLSKPEKEVLLANLCRDSGQIVVENFPDEEDLTQVQQGSQNVLKFKNKMFNPERFSGMGRVFLRKKMVPSRECGKDINILTQKAFEDKNGMPLTNTIFIIQYDYDLDKGFITIPENSVLVFLGGHLFNGTVILQNTLILPAALDIEKHLATIVRGNYAEGSLVYLRKKLRYYDGREWHVLGTPEIPNGPSFNPKALNEYISKQINDLLDLILPFKIEFYSDKNHFVKTSSQSVTLKWNYNRRIDSQKLNLINGEEVLEEKLHPIKTRSYTFTNIVPQSDYITIQLDASYNGRVESQTVTLPVVEATEDLGPGITGTLNGIKFEKGLAIGKA